jgi:hypothetical protein
VAAIISDGRVALTARLGDGSFTFGSVPHAPLRRPFVEVCAGAVCRGRRPAPVRDIPRQRCVTHRSRPSDPGGSTSPLPRGAACSRCD